MNQNSIYMRYSVFNIIHKPLEEVITKFTDTEGAKEWMPGLQHYERIQGEAYKSGTITEFHFLHKGREMKLKETILEENLPDQIKFSYESPMGYNEVEMLFEQLADGSTRQTNNSYFEFKGVMKYLSFLMKGMFKKQSMTYLNGFKEYAER